MYMSERRCGDAGKGPSPAGLLLGGRHPSARALTMDTAMICGAHLVWQPPKSNAIRQNERQQTLAASSSFSLTDSA